jgi:peptide/nickel transport system substrate-binding protein
MVRVAEPALFVSGVDPSVNQNAGGTPVANVICASLLRLADKPLPAGFRVVPELAKALPKVSAHRKTYVFRLRRHLRFNTGAPVRAADVAYTINRLLRIHSFLVPGFTDIVGARAVISGKSTHASGIVASGRTLTIHLRRPVPNFDESAASSLCVLPAGLPLDPNGVPPPIPSAAPYYVAEYVPGERIVLKRNTHYQGPRPQHVRGFVFDLTVDVNQAVNEAVSGKADYAWVPDFDYAQRASALANRFGVNRKRFFVKPATFLRLFVFHTSRPLFRHNAQLRRAISFAVDRKALLRQFGAHAGTVTAHYIPPIFPGYRSTHVFPLRRPDLKKARALARGHLRSGKLNLYVLSRPGLPAPAQAQILKRELKRIGLRVHIVTFPAGTAYFQRLANPREPFDMAWIGWEFTEPDPGDVLNGLFNGSMIGQPENANYSYFNVPKWNHALSRASRLAGKARYKAFGRLDVQLARQEAPALAYGVSNAFSLVSARTGCVIVNPWLDLEAVCLK